MVVVPCTPSSWPSPLGAVSSAAPEGSLVVARMLVLVVLVVLVLVLLLLLLLLLRRCCRCRRTGFAPPSCSALHFGDRG